MAKKQQMRWSDDGPHTLALVRVADLTEELSASSVSDLPSIPSPGVRTGICLYERRFRRCDPTPWSVRRSFASSGAGNIKRPLYPLWRRAYAQSHALGDWRQISITLGPVTATSSGTLGRSLESSARVVPSGRAASDCAEGNHRGCRREQSLQPLS
jgi:hypothetical protein